MKYIDLHTHTTFSDGLYTPKELMEYAYKKDLKAIGVTDHDTTDSHKEAAHWASHYGIEFVPGVEIEAAYENIELHILGYFIDITNKNLQSTLESLRNMRDNRNTKIIEIFKEDGINATIEDIQKLTGDKLISRPHFARFLVENGYYESVSDAMRNYLGRGKKAYVGRPLPTPSEAFSIIKEASGIPVLAHPIQYRLDYIREGNMLKELKSYGLSGIEAIYSVNSLEDTKRYIELAKKYSLLITGGSDFHGEIKPGLDLGTGYGDLKVNYSVLEKLKSYRDS
ncbi:MAG: PHP domain-containing protein [Defluviitaleaceae bacterium]|nr:PHP domain-containing protein [Defluviitaleaceae bacterium]